MSRINLKTYKMETEDLKELFGVAIDRYNMGFITECELWNELSMICWEKAKTASHE
jgi:hypothetical protein